MAVANGYGKTVTSGSVFAYDVGDTINSYKGQPTTNVVTNALPTSGWVASNAQGSTITRTFLVEDQPFMRFSNVTNGADYPRVVDSVFSNTITGTFSTSMEVRGTSGAILRFRIYENGSTKITNTITLTSEWVRYKFDNQTTAFNLNQPYFNPDTTGATYDIRNIQVEAKPAATSFVSGTRSSTQGLLPLIGNSTIDLSNVSFDSNAQKIFDGTDDYIQSSFSNFNTTNGSIECVIYPETGGGSDQMVLNVGGTTTFGASRILRILNGYWSFATYGSTNQDWTSIAQVSYNTWNHVVMNWEGTTLSIYINNIPYNIVKTGVTTPAGTLLRAGAAVWNLERYYKGKISIVKIYNRALSAAEVHQNYNKYKTRFNLP
jgi:hypothetical protein